MAETQDGDPIEETGMLVRDGGGFILRCDAGGVYRLELSRTPVDHVEKRVRVTGILTGDCITADGVALA